MTIRWIGHGDVSPTILINPSTRNNQSLKITNNEELLEYLKKNLDININLDLHLKNGNRLTLKFKKDLGDIKNKAATTIQAATRKKIASRMRNLLKSLKPKILKGRLRQFSVVPELTEEQKKLLEIHKAKGKKRKYKKRKSTKRKSTKRKSIKRKSTKRKSTKRKSIKRKSIKRKSTKK